MIIITAILGIGLSSLHDQSLILIDSSVWILRIQRVKASDSGLYSCELNTTPKMSISRIVAIAEEEDLPISGSSLGGSSKTLSILEVEHNYTDCCINEAVPKECHHFCQFRGLITDVEPQGTSVHNCINHLSSITKCLADGRDHMPCCRKQNIPETCRPVCVGNFSLTTVLDHFTCMHYTAPVLACIAEGVQILPPQVTSLSVDPISSTQVNVSWILPNKLSHAQLIEAIQVNVTQLDSFDGVGIRLSPEKRDKDADESVSTPTVKEVSDTSATTYPPPDLYGLQVRYTVAGNESSFIIPDLKPYTMYEIQVRSINRAGSSLPLFPIRTLTLTSGQSDTKKSQDPRDIEERTPAKEGDDEKDEETTPNEKKETSSEKESEGVDSHDNKKNSNKKPSRESEEESPPPSNDKKSPKKLPDMKQCCRSNGVMIDRCVNVLCDPVRSDEATLTDLMICAPFANVTFACLADGVDHTPCCKSRGVSSGCLDFCSGKVKRVDFRHFVCLDQLPSFSSCVLDHHQVLPGSPTNFMVVNVHHDWAIIKWNPPKFLGESITKYLIHYREVNSNDPSGRYNVTVGKKSPFLLDRLTPGGRYEVYVKAANEYGTSQGSSRVVFSTPPVFSNQEVELTATSTAYNETQCCSRAGIVKDCLPLCSYRVKVTDVLTRSSLCAQNLPTLVRCGAGGRNHIPCCRRRGVSDGCLNICAGLVDSSPYVVAARCSDDLAKILQCMEEGSGLLPGMPVDLHASLVTKDTIHLEWQSALEDTNVTSIAFQVRYGKTDSDIPLHPLQHDMSVNTTTPNALITGLDPGNRYSLYVVASNSYGISLPSLVLVVNTSSVSSDSRDDKKMISSNIGPPHSINVLHQSTDTITFKWMPPLYVPPDSSIKYIVYYKAVNGSGAENVTHDWTMIETSFNTMFLMNLTYETEYALRVQAINDRSNSQDKSSLSEVALVWTDPAIPASVNLPVIIPAGPIIEGNNVTFMCIGVGTPAPTLSLLLNGQVALRQERRHIALTVIGVKRNLTQVSCYATNGFSRTKSSSEAAQSSLEIRVRFKPKILTSTSVVHVIKMSPTRLQCEYTGNPQPHVIWFKDTADRKQVQVSPSPRISFVTVTHSDMTKSWINSLVIKSVNDSDAGDYHCMAVNDIGQDALSLELLVDISKNYTSNAKECCQSLSVAKECIGVCSFDVDIDSALSNPACYPELDKLMTCAADGSDHRSCCRRRGVPTDCIRWCAGLKVTKASLCSLSSAHDIVNCFQEGKALLPGPPKAVHVKHFLEGNRVRVEWDPPTKNPGGFIFLFFSAV